MLNLTRAAVQAKPRGEIEWSNFGERCKNPLPPIHVLCRKGPTGLGSLESAYVVPTMSSILLSSSIKHHTPSGSKRVHFHDRVEQCIVVDVEDGEEDDRDDIFEKNEGLSIHCVPKPKPEPRTIAKLPATTLRPGDEPIPLTSSSPIHSTGFNSYGDVMAANYMK